MAMSSIRFPRRFAYFIRFAVLLATASINLDVYSQLTEPLSYEKVALYITQNNIVSIEQLLASLPKTMRENYALVFSSRSTQPASIDAPRILLFSGDYKFSMAFSTAQQSIGSSMNLEILEYDESSARTIPRIIKFSEKKGIELIPDPLSVFPSNHPKNCARCHSSAMHPIWDAYPAWPGVYGDIHLRNGLVNIDLKQSQAIEKLKKASSKAHRYIKHLKNFESIDIRQLEKMNTKITEGLSNLNCHRIVESVASSANYEKYKRALIASTLNLDQFYKFIPDHKFDLDKLKLIERNIIDGTSQDFKKVKLMLERFSKKAGFRRSSTNFTNFDDNPVDIKRFAKLLYVLESAGIDTSAWTMSLRGTQFRGSTGQHSFIENLTRRLFSKILGLDQFILTNEAFDTHLKTTLNIDQRSFDNLIQSATVNEPTLNTIMNLITCSLSG